MFCISLWPTVAHSDFPFEPAFITKTQYSEWIHSCNTSSESLYTHTMPSQLCVVIFAPPPAPFQPSRRRLSAATKNCPPRSPPSQNKNTCSKAFSLSPSTRLCAVGIALFFSFLFKRALLFCHGPHRSLPHCRLRCLRHYPPAVMAAAHAPRLAAAQQLDHCGGAPARRRRRKG